MRHASNGQAPLVVVNQGHGAVRKPGLMLDPGNDFVCIRRPPAGNWSHIW